MLRSSFWNDLYCRLIAPMPGRRRQCRLLTSGACRVERLETRILLSAVGSETAVSPTTSVNQLSISPRAVAADAAGDYVVTWTEFTTGPNSTYTSYAQRYNASGVAQGSKITIPGRDTQVAIDANGNFAISFESGAVGSRHVYVQRFDNTGTLLGTIQVDDVGSNGNDSAATIAMDDAGDFVVTWFEITQPGVNVYARKYSAAGVAQGSAVLVTSDPGLAYSNVAMDASGDFVVTWGSEVGIPGGAISSSTTIWAQRYNSSAVAQGSAIQVSTGLSNSVERPAVAMDGAGNFVVTWAAYNDLGMNAAFAQLFNSQGVAQGAIIQVNATAAIDASVGLTSVDMDAAGEFVVTWRQTGANVDGTEDIFGQRFDATGARQGSEFLVNTTTDGHQFSASVAMDAAGDFVVLWSSAITTPNLHNVFFQRFNSSPGTVGLSGIEPFPLQYTPAAPAVAVTSTLIVNDTNPNVTGATISIAGYQPGDLLSFSNTANISGTFNSGTGVLTLTGTDSVANYQAALRSITYSSSNSGSRTIGFQVADGADLSNVQSRIVGSPVVLVGNVLYVYGTQQLDVISMAETASLDVTVNGVLYQFTPAQVGGIQIYGLDGNDSILVNSLLNGTSLLILGGNGNDSINVSSNVTGNVGVGGGIYNGGLYGGAGDDLLLGGSGSDVLVGGLGNDWMNGGAGSDVSIGGLGNDVYAFDDTPANDVDTVIELANQGTDLLTFASFATSVTVNLTSDSALANSAHRIVQTRTAGQAANFENVNGGSAADNITGNAANNVIYGNGGNDTLKGGDGNDQLDGGLGNDLMLGGNQDDFLIGGGGDDYLKGEAGNDFLAGGDGFNTLVGGIGNDMYIFGTATTNQVDTVVENAAEGTDTLNFSSLSTAVTVNLTSDTALATMDHRIVQSGGSGQAANFENVYGGSANDQITGNGADNELFGNGGNDTITGNGGNDILVGGAGNDTLKGISGQNILIGGTGADLLLGGTGEDLMFSGSTVYDTDPVVLKYLLAEWASVNPYQTRIDHLLGTTPGGANSTLTLNPTTAHNDTDADYLTGGTGRDWFLASSAQDVLTDRAVDEVFTQIDSWV
jgi:Ca2+-binding RTX toxin-like protein